jgi:hypothetical protein
MLFRLWESINSYNYDERMLHILSQLAELHVNPTISDPKRIDELPDDARSDDEGRPNWPKDDLKHDGPWTGIYKDVGIFSEDEWNLIMWKCLASMGTCENEHLVMRAYRSHRDSFGGLWLVEYRPVRRQPVRIRDWPSEKADVAHM